MLFQVYGDNAIYQWIGWILVFCCLIGANELARRTKTGGVIAFLVIPALILRSTRRTSCAIRRRR